MRHFASPHHAITIAIAIISIFVYERPCIGLWFGLVCARVWRLHLRNLENVYIYMGTTQQTKKWENKEKKRPMKNEKIRPRNINNLKHALYSISLSPPFQSMQQHPSYTPCIVFVIERFVSFRCFRKPFGHIPKPSHRYSSLLCVDHFCPTFFVVAGGSKVVSQCNTF